MSNKKKSKKENKKLVKIILTSLLILILGFVIFFLFKKTIFAPTHNKNFDVFSGTMPCADCEGIQTTLTIYHNPMTYSLQLVYLGRDSKPYVEVGKWNITYGTAKNPTAVVYNLVSNNSSTPTEYYLKINDSKLELLDNNKEKINSSFDFTLNLRK